HRALMRLYARGGRRQQALRQYHILCEALERELAAEPEPATQELHADMLAGRGPAARPVQGDSTAVNQVASALPTWGPVARRRTNLPAQLTSFIGRARPMDEVRRLLTTSRMLTLTGVGGCGKTRLAFEVAARLTDR